MYRMVAQELANNDVIHTVNAASYRIIISKHFKTSYLSPRNKCLFNLVSPIKINIFLLKNLLNPSEPIFVKFLQTTPTIISRNTLLFLSICGQGMDGGEKSCC